MAFACPFCNRVLSNRSAYSQHVKRCSENYASSSSEEIFIQNESDIIMSEQEDNSKDNRNNEIIYISDDESRSSPRSNRINDIIQIDIDERPQNIDSLTFEEHASIQYEEPASREREFETEESKFESDKTESESDKTESESDKTEFEPDKTDNESDESEESESAEEEIETIPKFPNNTYSDLMTLIIQHNLNNKAGNAIIRFFNKHSNLPTSPLPKNIEQGRKLMDRMKLINLLNKEKVILKYNNKDYIIYYRPIINCIKNILSINDIHNNITFNFKNDQSNNNRNYNEQYTANWWAKTEKTIPLGSHLLSIILYSDASTTDTLGKNTLHPIFITLGNIITWRRNKPDVKQLLAYLPIIKAKDDTQKKSEEHKNIVRRTFHKSLKFLLSPLYNEDNGIELELNNRILWCIPRISMIISDWPEACTFSLTYKSTQSNHPYVKQLLAYLPIIKAKDDTQKKSEEHKNIVRRTFHKSLKFLLSPLYNEDNGIELELNNRILWCIPRISMIISDWPEACTFSLTYKSTQSNHPCHFCLVSKENLSNINLNSNQIEPRSHKNMKLHYKNNTEKNVSIEKVRNFFWNVPDINIYAATVPDRMHHFDLGLFHYQLSFTKALILEQCEKSFIDKMNNRIKLIPHYQDLKSFSNGFLHLTLLTASEYRSLMKIMIFIVDNLYQDFKRPNFIKNNKITEIYLKWNKMYLLSRKENYEESDITCLQESINEWVKLFIELFEEYSSSKLQFPKLHSWVFYICSSIREFGAINGYTTETYESLHKDYVKKPYKLTNKKEIEKQIMKIIRRKAIITESFSKEIPKTPIALKYSKKLYEFCIQNVEIYIQTRMNDLDLEKEMKLGFEKFLKCLDAYLDFYDQKLSEHEEIDIKFRIYSGVTLKYGAKMRANNKFHKRPIFSNIAVEMNPDEIFEYTSDNGVCFAQVLLITEIIMNYEEPMHLALVQWYDFKSSVNPYLYECPLLEKTNIFNLIEIEAINDIIHIIPQENSPVQKGKNFEMKIEKLLTDANIKCEITGGPGDKGIDIKGMKKGVKFIIECKNWRTKNIDRSIINQIEGVLSRQSNGTIGIVAAPSMNRYTPRAKETARTTK
ncbi:hypothetical protein Glove_41g45 [Diversispora epigaea]|uniref:Uncharacterized protein n=1 Tax=Diversispora epigaea TaxID=1348612 RepID=A0A397JG55_9GLOM|nr:hypothetical protein Glove_41g45 [Diversispora epigaea]